ncbi:FAD-dependent oxidoreductase [Tateyamaria sp. ANG-S1]|uniref:NAD(P)/FAD-dependent oxidoreductase n=1 Tax=Tateyamaria sp. ANG-S1 TaxID=1577905 RepID=UPI00057FA8D1|nr:FAD-dependent oxidoreductase [Tateyamaria sp. ANG-S1]KIC49649.1 FAD-dependent oxidoreductase [Tateyamaria sp. ANG-S1]
MKRVFSSYAYGDGPRAGCWWDETVSLPDFPSLQGDLSCDVAIVGAGFTGLSAALALAREGARVAVLEASTVGWGASGRNGGFCCLGGSMRSDAALDHRFGVAARRAWRRTERAAVEGVERLVDELAIDVDRHSVGETCLAHRARDFEALRGYSDAVRENCGVEPELLFASELKLAGFGGPFHGALTIPLGFGLNPRKLLAGLADACIAQGVEIYENTPATSVQAGQLMSGRSAVRAPQIIIATNGYSSEDVPGWMAGRYMPVQSSVVVTRPLTSCELSDQGWTTDQMAYDTRHLLRYFRLLPDRRFLFGMRGGLSASPAGERAARAAVVRGFRRMFPAWAEVEVTHGWSGMVCLARDRVPYVGHVPGMPGVLAGFAYHGNGVAMGIHCGELLAKLAGGGALDQVPAVVAQPASRFPFGRLRRIIMPGIYAALKAVDALP